MKNKVYNVIIKILTPVNIGNGNTISGIDYFCYQKQLRFGDKKHEGGKFNKVYESFLYKYNLKDLIKILEEEDKKTLEDIIYNGNIIEIRNKVWYFLKDKETKEYKKWLEEQRKEVKENINYKEIEYKNVRYEESKYKENFLNKVVSEKIKISNTFFSEYIKKMAGKGKQIKGKNEENRENNQISQLNIQEFIKNINGYYIPGSSLKGAIRTVLTNKNIETLNAENDPFKKLIVRDSEQIKEGTEIGALARKSKKSKDENGEIKGDGTYAQFIKRNIILNTKIILKYYLQSNNDIVISKEEIIKESNKYYKEKIKKYITQLDKLSKKDISSDKIKKIYATKKSFNNILNEIKKLLDNECILNIGFGGGYWFKSFSGEEYHPNRDNISEKSKLKDKNIAIPRTNNLTQLQEDTEQENLGFIKLTFTD